MSIWFSFKFRFEQILSRKRDVIGENESLLRDFQKQIFVKSIGALKNT